MRPFQSFEMGSIVVMKAGTDTGMTVVGNSGICYCPWHRYPEKT